MTRTVRLADVVLSSVKNRNPVSVPDAEFVYVDVAAVDNKTKTIVGAKKLIGADAPSRARKVLKAGDVLVSTVRPNLNAVALVPASLDDQIGSTGFCVLRARSELLLPEYLLYFVRSKQFVQELTNLVSGALYPAVTDRQVLEQEIPLPSLNEQRRIVDLLTRAEGIVRLHREAEVKARAVGPALFLDMFGDPATNPKRWPSVCVGDLVLAAQDGPHVSPTYAETGIPFLSTRHIRPGQIVFEDLKYLAHDEAERQWKKCKPERGDVLYTKGGTTGLAAAIGFDTPIAVWVHVAVLKTDHSKVHPIWLESMLNSEFCYRQSQELTHGIANRDLGLKRMVKIAAYHPPLAEQGRFVESMVRLHAVRQQLTAATTKAQAVFDSILARAFPSELAAVAPSEEGALA